MTSIQKILPITSQVLKRYSLCNYCLGRLFSRQLGLTSNKLLGKKLQEYNSQRCYICKNLYNNIKSLLETMLEKSTQYEFETFAVGTQIQPSIIDRDDLVRSEFKLMGTDSIKTDITHELSKQFAKKTRKTVNILDPDLTFLINIKDNSCHIQTKNILLKGRYTKTIRGFPQKQKSCMNCNGKGCQQCNYHGIDNFESVEGKISQILFSMFHCTTARFTWIGGEDRSSLVLGMGRPFFVKIQNPIKRHPKFTRKIKLDFIELYNCKIIDSFPILPIQFYSTIKIIISTDNRLNTSTLRKLKSSIHSPIIVYEDSGKRSEKYVTVLKCKKLSNFCFVLFIDAEGGLPIKRFVEGNNVNPSISQILNMTCNCVQFDFVNVYDKILSK